MQIGVWLGWVVALVLIEGTIFSAWVFYLPGREYNALLAAFYGAFHRITWSIGTSWLILAISTGNGGKTARAVIVKNAFFASRKLAPQVGNLIGDSAKWDPVNILDEADRMNLFPSCRYISNQNSLNRPNVQPFFTPSLLWKSKDGTQLFEIVK